MKSQSANVLLTIADTQDEVRTVQQGLIFYKEQRILHQQIVEDYQNDYEIDLLIKRATEKQTVITTDALSRNITSPEDLKDYLKRYSKTYRNISGVESLAEGGEASVFTIEHNGQDEIVAKIPLFEEGESKEEIVAKYLSMLYESQTLKMNPLHDNIA